MVLAFTFASLHIPRSVLLPVVRAKTLLATDVSTVLGCIDFCFSECTRHTYLVQEIAPLLLGAFFLQMGAPLSSPLVLHSLPLAAIDWNNFANMSIPLVKRNARELMCTSSSFTRFGGSVRFPAVVRRKPTSSTLPSPGITSPNHHARLQPHGKRGVANFLSLKPSYVAKSLGAALLLWTPTANLLLQQIRSTLCPPLSLTCPPPAAWSVRGPRTSLGSCSCARPAVGL